MNNPITNVYYVAKVYSGEIKLEYDYLYTVGMYSCGLNKIYNYKFIN